MTDSIELYSQLLRHALGDRLANGLDRFEDMLSEDGVVEYPFAPHASRRRIEGREALGAHLRRVSGSVIFDSMSEPIVHQTTDPSVLIIEFEASGRATSSNRPYDQSYIAIIKTRNGFIEHMREYWNPIEVIRMHKGKKAVDDLLDDVWPKPKG